MRYNKNDCKPTDPFPCSPTSRLLFDNNPHINMLFDDQFNVVDCNPEAVRYFEFSSKENFIAGIIPLILGGIPQHQPTGRESVPFSEILAITAEKGYHESNIEFMIRGRITLFHVILKRIPIRDSFVIAAYLTEPQKTEEIMQLHAWLLQAVNTVATNLFKSGPDTFANAVRDSLRIIGETVNVDRVYIWENFEQEGKIYCRQIYESSESAEPQQGKDFTVSIAYDDLPYWKYSVFSNKVINGPIRNLPDNERFILETQGIRSVLILPIHINSHPWGFIGFDDCNVERTFTSMEEHVLHSAGVLMISAILRNGMTRRLIDTRNDLLYHEKLLRAVNQTARFLLETDHDDFLYTIHLALATLGLCVGAIRVSVWRNGDDEDGRSGASQLVVWDLNQPFDKNKTAPFLDYERYLPEWSQIQQDINSPVREMNENLRSFLTLKDSHTLLLLPLNFQGHFWGLISFVPEREGYLFNETEKSILRSGGMLISSAIIRNEITESLVEARESALASARSKSDFLSRMSHEIRTPMNAIIGMTTLAKKSKDIKKIKRYLDTVDASSRQLLGIINDVLDMSKIDADKLEITNKEFDFEKTMRHVFNVIQVKLDEKKLNFQFDLPQMFSRNMICDDLRLSQVLLNLLGNAVKFTPDCGKIVLRVRDTPTDPTHSMLRVEIIDNGIGISPALIPHMFKSFEQGDGSITRQYGGTGLGLAICKRIINLMGGEIWVESEPGHGSRFIFEIPVEWGGGCESSSGSATLRSDLRILVVDGSPDILEYFKNLLSSFSLNCDTALNEDDAIGMVSDRMAAGKPYDIVFLDWYMPIRNGGETAREFLRIMHNNVVVIMISSADWNEIEKDASSAGVQHFLTKPVLASDLYNALVQLTDKPFSVAEAAQDETTYNWSSHCILLAEDIEINREIVAGILEGTGIRIDNAGDGQEAVDMYMAEPNKYKMILMDVQMPVMDGLSAARQIRSSGMPGSETIPIIAMTANAFKEDEQASFDAGMNGHIAKPIDVAELYGKLSEILD